MRVVVDCGYDGVAHSAPDNGGEFFPGGDRLDGDRISLAGVEQQDEPFRTFHRTGQNRIKPVEIGCPAVTRSQQICQKRRGASSKGFGRVDRFSRDAIHQKTIGWVFAIWYEKACGVGASPGPGAKTSDT